MMLSGHLCSAAEVIRFKSSSKNLSLRPGSPPDLSKGGDTDGIKGGVGDGLDIMLDAAPISTWKCVDLVGLPYEITFSDTVTSLKELSGSGDSVQRKIVFENNKVLGYDCKFQVSYSDQLKYTFTCSNDQVEIMTGGFTLNFSNGKAAFQAQGLAIDNENQSLALSLQCAP